MLRTVYSQLALEPELSAPESVQRQTWERTDASRELLRGRMEVCGPVTANELTDILNLSHSEIDAALLALEAEGFVLRGKFHPNAVEQEWCDRRLLARIHRLTIDRLRAEIQPVSPQDFYRFLFAWQRVDAEHRVGGCAEELVRKLDSVPPELRQECGPQAGRHQVTNNAAVVGEPQVRSGGRDGVGHAEKGTTGRIRPLSRAWPNCRRADS